MSRQTLSALESQLSSAKNELELATFLNKGILQTNTEYKLRIAELESENVILSKAESKLSETEDQLEESQQLNKKLKNAQRDLMGERDGLIRLNGDLEKEVKVWKDNYLRLRDKIQYLLSNENQDNMSNMASNDKLSSRQTSGGSSSAIIDKKKVDGSTPVRKPRPTSTSTTSKRRSTGTQSKNQQQQPSIHDHDNQPISSTSKISLSPVRPPNRSTSKKRRRVEDSNSEYDSSDDRLPSSNNGQTHVYNKSGKYDKGGNNDYDHEEEEGGDEGEESVDPLGGSYPHNTQLTPPPRNTYTPRSRSKITNTNANTSTNTNNLSANSNSNKKRTYKKRDSTKQTVLGFTIKDEPLSPGGRDGGVGSDSDYDPLAMV